MKLQLTEEAKKVYEAVQDLDSANDLEGELAEIAGKWSCSDGFEYGLYDGGYIKLEDILVGEDLGKAWEAMRVLGEVRELWSKISLEL